MCLDGIRPQATRVECLTVLDSSNLCARKRDDDFGCEEHQGKSSEEDNCISDHVFPLTRSVYGQVRVALVSLVSNEDFAVHFASDDCDHHDEKASENQYSHPFWVKQVLGKIIVVREHVFSFLVFHKNNKKSKVKS